MTVFKCYRAEWCQCESSYQTDLRDVRKFRDMANEEKELQRRLMGVDNVP